MDSHYMKNPENNCPICNRELGDGASVDKHHLIPKSKKGKGAEWIHVVCHHKIHSVFSEKELKEYYHTWDRILENEDIIKFVKWVAKKPITFTDHAVDTKSRKKKRRR